MSDPQDAETLEQLRVLLERLEHSPTYDPCTTAFVKRFIRTRIRALEAAQSPAPDRKDPTLSKKQNIPAP